MNYRSSSSFVCLLAVLSVVLHNVNRNFAADLRQLEVTEWWEKSGFYQIYPRSFKDSNGDGIGDLNGITEKLQYLKDLGIKAFWLSPIYKSPMADFGYDIADFRAIQPEYGTMEDFERMVNKSREIGLKVILDFVPNHSSDEHEWFNKSVNRVAGYEDYYVWHDGIPGDNPDLPNPPNNWVEAFRGSAWKWNPTRGQYYLHQFHYKQPDLNYRNPTVVEEMKNVLRFWLDKGVDGFRIDAVPWLFEDSNLRSEPASGYCTDELMPCYLNHVYTQDLPETVDMVYQWREVMDQYKVAHGGETRVLMTEAWSGLSIVATYFQDENKRQGSQMPFNFQLIMGLDQNSKATNFKTVIDSWLNTVPAGHTPNWVLGNHDKRRVASRMGGEHMADIMEMVELSLPGISVTYQGEELGMTDYEVSWEDSKDPAACQTSKEVYQQYTRDPARTPFQWNPAALAGFTNGTSSWLPVNPNYVTINVQTEANSPKSHLKVFMQLFKLRDETEFHNTKFGTAVLNTNAFAIVREAVSNGNVHLTLVNIANANTTVNALEMLKSFNISSQESMQVAVASVNSKRAEGDLLNTEAITLDAYEGIVLRSASGAAVALSSLFILIVSIFTHFKVFSQVIT